MSNKKDWETLEVDIKGKEDRDKSKYKVDIQEQYSRLISRGNNFKLPIKKIFIIMAFIILFIIINSILKSYWYQFRRDNLIYICRENAEETAFKTDIFGNGLYIYKMRSIPDVEGHAIMNIFKSDEDGKFTIDIVDRIHKSYFEKWEDNEKEKFTIEENYDEGWLLNYETYIETSNYSEVMEAARIIVKYIDYFGIKVSLGNHIYIKYGDNVIIPQTGSGQSGDRIIRNVQQGYNNIYQ